MSDPTITLREGYDELDHSVQRLALIQHNHAADLRAAVDSLIGQPTPDDTQNVTKEWLATCLLALGGPEAAAVDVERRGAE